MSDIDAAVGISKLSDSYTAGMEAARSALENQSHTPQVLIIFVSPKFEHKQVLAGIISVTGEMPMVGGTTAGEISNSGFSEDSVVIMALSSDTLRFATGIGLNMSLDEAECGAELAKKLINDNPVENALSLLIFPNGMGGDGVKVISGLHSVLGTDFEIVGGYLGDDENFGHTFQYFNGKVYKDSITGLLIYGSSSCKTGIGVRSGFESIGNRFECTSSDGHLVKEFDHGSALELYKEFLGNERAKQLPGICLEYPFGLIDEKVSIDDHEYFQLRCGLMVDHEKGTISLAGSIPEGSSITLTTASRKDIINGAKNAAEQALKSLKGANPRAILMFSCVGRKLVLGRRTEEEIMAVREIIGEDVPIIGFYTYGEIGPIDKLKEDLSTTKFHNETVVLWIIGCES